MRDALRPLLPSVLRSLLVSMSLDIALSDFNPSLKPTSNVIITGQNSAIRFHLYPKCYFGQENTNLDHDILLKKSLRRICGTNTAHDKKLILKACFLSEGSTYSVNVLIKTLYHYHNIHTYRQYVRRTKEEYFEIQREWL